MSLNLPKPPQKYDANDQAQLRAIIERADAQSYKKSTGFLSSLLLSLLTVDGNIIQRKSGAVVERTPTQLVADMPTIPAQLGTQAANKVFAGPSSGSAANPAFRSLVSADIPSLATLAGTQTKNTVWAGPATGSAASPAFRALVGTDISGISGLGVATSFTPTYTSTGTAPTVTYATQTGSCYQFGPICIITIDIQTATVSSVGTGTLQVGGLPFANANSSPCSYFASFVQNFSGAVPYVGAVGAGAQVVSWRDSSFANVPSSTLNTVAGSKNRLQVTIVMPVSWP